MINLQNVGMFAGFGALGMMWQQIKSLFDRFASIFVVTVKLEGCGKSDFMAYCWTHLRVSKFGVRVFGARTIFFKSANKIKRGAFESNGEHLTFWIGWRPIFIKTPKDNTSIIEMSFIRGTFDIEKLIIDAVNYGNEQESDKVYKKRFKIKKCFGLSFQKDKDNNTVQPDNPQYGCNSDYSPEYRPIGYSWNDIGPSVPESPFLNLHYNKEVIDFKQEIVHWKNSEKWYREKGLNWRFGAGAFGPPGTGKTGFVRAIAQELDMPIHSYDLTTMDNQEVYNFWNESLAQSPCIVLFEDLDRIFDNDKNIKTNKNKSLTLDCLLNCINGVEPANGILVFITANDITKIDPALGVPDEKGDSTRPGRLDRCVFFGPLTEEARHGIANRILSDYKEIIEQVVLEGEGQTGAQFENKCSKLALEHYWGKPKVFGKNYFLETSLKFPDGEKTLDDIRREDTY